MPHGAPAATNCFLEVGTPGMLVHDKLSHLYRLSVVTVDESADGNKLLCVVEMSLLVLGSENSMVVPIPRRGLSLL